MIISLIAAVSENGVIGREGELPWKLPKDLQLFRMLTTDHHLIVGRMTFESIGRPLPGRKMIVLSTRANYRARGCQTASSLAEALEIARQAGEIEVFIGGGAQVYTQAFPLADRLYLSRVHATFTGDTYFPDFNPESWKTTLKHRYKARQGQRYDFTFMVLDRIKRTV